MSAVAARLERLDRVIWPLAGAGAVLSVLLLVWWLPLHAFRTDSVRSNVDHVVYYEAARNLAAGVRVYGDGFLYPPSFLALIAPASHASFALFQAIWYALLLAGLWFYAWGLVVLALGRATVPRVLAALFVLYMTPGMAGVMSCGNVDVLVWALLAWSLFSDSPRRDVGIGLAAVLKVFPATALVVLLQRDRRAAARVVAVGAVALAASALIVGWGPIGEWAREGFVPLPSCVFKSNNVSPPTLLLEVVGVVNTRCWQARILYAASSLVSVVTAWWLTRDRSARVACSALMIATVVSAPVCWSHYFPLVYLLVASLVREKVSP